MSRDISIPQSETTEHSATGGFPSDFFEAPWTEENEAKEVAPRDGQATPRRSVPRAPSPGPGPPRSILPVVGIVLLGNIILFLGGALAGWALAKKETPVVASEASSAVHPFVTEVARSVDSKASKDEVGGLKSVLGDLEAELKAVKAELAAVSRESGRLKERLDRPREVAPVPTLPSPSAAAPDLKPLQARIDDLAESNKRLASLPADFNSLGKRFGEVDRQLELLRTEVGALPKRIKEAVTPPPQPVVAKPEKTAAKAADEARMQGASLFKEGKFVEARDVFLKLIEDSPDDARLWYYAALANGFGTSDWRGETVRLVTRGIERERVGTPARAEIDASFNDLNQPTGKEWLRGWRERVGTR